jgi:hypothetical protein
MGRTGRVAVEEEGSGSEVPLLLRELRGGGGVGRCSRTKRRTGSLAGWLGAV